MATEVFGDVDGRRVGTWTDDHRSRFGLVPPAVTPVAIGDVARSLVDHSRGRGRTRFRDAIVSSLGGAEGATYSSYRRALAACVRTIERREDGETVLVPAFCSQDFAAAVEGLGLAIDRYDVEPTTLAADVEDLERRLDEETLAVVAVSPLGYSSRMDELAAACVEADVALVEAIGYAIGSTYDGAPIGSFGDYAVLNFQEGKPIPVGGGMVVAAEECGLSDVGRPAAPPNVGVLLGYAVCARPRPYRLYEWVTDWIERHDGFDDRVTTHPGSKAGGDFASPVPTMSNFQGALGQRVLDRHASNRRHRARTAAFYREALPADPRLGHLTGVAGLADHQHVRYPLLVESTTLRTALQRALAENGIQTSILYDWPPLRPEDHPGAASVQARILTLPTHPYVDRSARLRVVDTVEQVLDRW